MNEFVVTINEKKINVTFNSLDKAEVNGKEYNFNLININNNSYRLFVDFKSYLITVRKIGNAEFIVTLNGREIETKVLSALQEKAAAMIEATTVKQAITIVKSPMPGMILKIKKKPGEEILQGDSLLILEAMKMENDIRSPVSGKIKEINVKEGQAVEKGISLLVIE